MSVTRPLAMNRREVMSTAGAAALLPLSFDAQAATRKDAPLGLGRDQSFDLGWCFFRGTGDGFEASNMDDKGWRSVDLPHDWSIEDVPAGKPPRQSGPFDKDSPTGTATGFTAGGEGWYRKHFRLAALPPCRRMPVWKYCSMAWQ